MENRAGEFFSLLGPSGCGKTTSLRMIARLRGADRGHDPARRATTSSACRPYKPQRQHRVPELRAVPAHDGRDNVAFGLRARKVAEAEIASRVERDARARRSSAARDSRKPRQLSGGQQQRVALARALVNEPEVLLLDEPLGALDLKLRKQMQLELKRIQREVGMTFVYVTHDQDEAHDMTDRIAVMNRGRGRADRRATGASTNGRAPRSSPASSGVANICRATVTARGRRTSPATARGRRTRRPVCLRTPAGTPTAAGAEKLAPCARRKRCARDGVAASSRMTVPASRPRAPVIPSDVGRTVDVGQTK